MMVVEKFQTAVKQLQGARLLRVRYYELPGGWPTWDAEPEFDHPEQGMDLICDTGNFYITWDSMFWNYGLTVGNGLLIDQLQSAVFTDVTDESRWTPLINQHIAEVEIHWEETPPYEGHVTDWPYYPQHLSLIFEEKQNVLLSASTYRSDSQTFFGTSDHVIVAFDEETKKRLQPKTLG